MYSASLAWPHPFPQEREGVWPRETSTVHECMLKLIHG